MAYYGYPVGANITTTSGTISGTANNMLYMQWVGDTTASLSNMTWKSWVDNGNSTVNYSVTFSPWPGWVEEMKTVPPTFKMAAPDPKIEQRIKERALKEKLKRQRARREQKKRAEEMLRSVLTKDQWAQWVLYRAIRIDGRRGIFEINPASMGELFLLSKEGKAIEKFCVHASNAYCVEDRVAALVLALQADEDDVMRRANRPGFRNDTERWRLEKRRLRLVEAA